MMKCKCARGDPGARLCGWRIMLCVPKRTGAGTADRSLADGGVRYPILGRDCKWRGRPVRVAASNNPIQSNSKNNLGIHGYCAVDAKFWNYCHFTRKTGDGPEVPPAANDTIARL